MPRWIQEEVSFEGKDLSSLRGRREFRLNFFFSKKICAIQFGTNDQVILFGQNLKDFSIGT